MQWADVERALRRPGEYFFEDGLWEIAIGLWLTLTVAIPAFVGGRLGNWAPVLMLLASLAVTPAVVAAKERWVYPRTGHVSYASTGATPEPLLGLDLRGTQEPIPGRGRLQRLVREAPVALLGAATAIVIALVTRVSRDSSSAHPRVEAWPGHVLLGLLVGGAFVYASWRFRQRRWLIVGSALALSGPLVASWARGREQAVAWHACFMGAALLASGLAAFVQCLRQPSGVSEADAR